MGPQFFETRMGHQFYDGTMKRLVEAAERIATSLEQHAAQGVLKLEAGNLKPYISAAPRQAVWTALIGEVMALLHDHDTAWDNEEESVKEEHAELIERTREFLARMSKAEAYEKGPTR